MFDDLNRYCWHQPVPASSTSNQAVSSADSNLNTDGHIYTITVLNGGGSETPWMRKDAIEPTAPSLDLDTILGGFSGYSKAGCFNYDDSGFATDHNKADVVQQRQHSQHQQQLVMQSQSRQQPNQVQSPTTTNVILGSSDTGTHVLASFPINNNDWHMSDHNTEQVSSFFSFKNVFFIILWHTLVLSCICIKLNLINKN